MGTVMAFDLSVRMNLCPPEDLQRVERHFTKMGMLTRPSLMQKPLNTTAEKLFEYMHRDKKVLGGRLRLILVSGIGEAFITGEYDENALRQVLENSLLSQTETGKDKESAEGNAPQVLKAERASTINKKLEFQESASHEGRKRKNIKRLWNSIFTSQ